MANDQARRAQVVTRVLVALAVAGLLASAYPAYRYSQAEMVAADLSDCARPKGKRVDCTARWRSASGAVCQARESVSRQRDREIEGLAPRTAPLRVDGCEIRGPLGPGVLAAMAICLLFGGVIAAGRAVRRSFA